METVLNLFARGFLTQDQAIRAIDFINTPEGFTLRPWEEAFLRAILIDRIGIEEAESRFVLPSRSAKAIMKLLLQHHADAPRPCAKAVPSVHSVDAEEGLRVLARASLNEELILIAEFKFTPLEARFFEVVKNARIKPTAKDHIISVLYQDRTDSEVPDGRIVDTVVCKVRAKIKGSPFSIETVPGRGYHFHSSFAAPPAKRDILEYFAPEDMKRLCGRDPLELLKLATEFGLSPMEARFVAVLRNAMTDPTPKEYVLSAMFFDDPEEEFGEKSFDVLCYKTNLKLERFGGSISRISGGGTVLNWPAEAWV